MSLLAALISQRIYQLTNIDLCHVKDLVLSFLLSPVRATEKLQIVRYRTLKMVVFCCPVFRFSRVKIKGYTVFGRILPKYANFAWFLDVFTIRSYQQLNNNRYLCNFGYLEVFLPVSRGIAYAVGQKRPSNVTPCSINISQSLLVTEI